MPPHLPPELCHSSRKFFISSFLPVLLTFAMTIVLTPYWSNGVQKFKIISQCTLSLLPLNDEYSYFIHYLAPATPKPGLIPPALNASIHAQRCLAQLRSKDKSIEKYIYLSHLKNEDPSTFYKLCLENMVEITPIIYTPTVGDACLQFSHIYRRPEGLVCISQPVTLARN